MCMISDWCAPGRTYAVWSLSPSVGRRPSVVFCIAGQAVRALREEALESWLSVCRTSAYVPFRQRQNKQRIKPMTNVQRSRRQVRLSRALGIALTPKLSASSKSVRMLLASTAAPVAALNPITQCVCARSSVFAPVRHLREAAPRRLREGHPHRRPDRQRHADRS